MLNVSIGDAPAELRAAVLAMKRADRVVRNSVFDDMKETMTPVWKSELSQRASSAVGYGPRILPANARITNGNPAQLVTANSKRKLGHGVIPSVHWAGYEYGANRNAYRSVKSSKGKTYKRRTNRHLPARNKTGYVIGPTVAEVLPRAAAFWAQSVVRQFMDAAEEGGF